MEHDVVEAVNKYVDGVRTSNAAAVKDSFREDAVMWGYLGDQLVIMSGAEFADQVVATAPVPDTSYRAEIHSVAVTGNVASAILDERAFLGADFRNYFGLVRSDGSWKIASKIFTTTGGEAPAPAP